MSRFERWESWTEVPMAGAAVVFLLAYGMPIVWVGTPAWLAATCHWLVLVCWGAFVLDVVVRFTVSEHRWKFVEHNVVDILAVVLPVVRPLRFLRLVALLAVLNRFGAHTLHGRVITYLAGGSSLLVLTGALAITDAERGQPGATITGFGDGLWWSITTMTTVGYGDHHPVTTTGRAVAAALMIGGIALLGLATATLASWLVGRVAADAEGEAPATHAQVAELSARVDALLAQLEERERGDERAALECVRCG